MAPVCVPHSFDPFFFLVEFMARLRGQVQEVVMLLDW